MDGNGFDQRSREVDDLLRRTGAEAGSAFKTESERMAAEALGRVVAAAKSAGRSRMPWSMPSLRLPLFVTAGAAAAAALFLMPAPAPDIGRLALDYPSAYLEDDYVQEVAESLQGAFADEAGEASVQAETLLADFAPVEAALSEEILDDQLNGDVYGNEENDEA